MLQVCSDDPIVNNDLQWTSCSMEQDGAHRYIVSIEEVAMIVEL